MVNGHGSMGGVSAGQSTGTLVRGEKAFFEACKSFCLEKHLQAYDCETLVVLKEWLESETELESLPLLVYVIVTQELADRYGEQVQKRMELEAEGDAEAEEILDRAQGYDHALRGSGGGSGKCEVRSVKSQQDGTSNQEGER